MIARAISIVIFLLFLIAPAAIAQNAPAWQPYTQYSVGNVVSYNGLNYSCLQSHKSLPVWDPPDVPALWQPNGSKGGGSCQAAPAAPTGLAASNVSSTGVSLTWTPPAAPPNCTLGNFTVYQNGVATATVSGTTLNVTGLSPFTRYSFSVTAGDSFGNSNPGSSISVMTAASGGGGSCATAWNAASVYTGGMTASLGGVNYRANWWTQGQSPASNSGPSGSGQPWTTLATCAVCTAIPSVPTGLSASQITGYSAALTWNAATVPANCNVSGYTVYQNGTPVGTATGTAYTVAGLSPQTSYSFSIAAGDLAGSSAQSPAVNVTTGAPVSGGAKMFAPYIDMSLVADQDLITIQQQSGIKTFTLAFVLSNGGCAAGWGGVGTISNDTLPNGTTILSQVQGVRAAGGDVIISFGGANGTELAQACPDAGSLQVAYQSVIDRYGVRMIDIDIEGAATTDQASITRRDKALANIKAANAGLVVSYTLPVLPTGLIDSGVNILRSLKADGLNLDVVNIMAMDYGASVDNGGAMGMDATLAATATENQILAAGLTARIGITPMIGVNDTQGETFQLADAQTVLNFANPNAYVTRLAMWSVGRDNGSCAGTRYASASCSGLAQTAYQFSKVFEAFQ